MQPTATTERGTVKRKSKNKNIYLDSIFLANFIDNCNVKEQSDNEHEEYNIDRQNDRSARVLFYLMQLLHLQTVDDPWFIRMDHRFMSKTSLREVLRAVLEYLVYMDLNISAGIESATKSIMNYQSWS